MLIGLIFVDHFEKSISMLYDNDSKVTGKG